MEALKDMDLAQLTLFHGLSVRAVHVCEAAELARLSDIRAFHTANGGFAKLPNCGQKTVLELETMLANLDQLSESVGNAPTKRLPEKLVVQIYEGHFQRLSADAQHVLWSMLGTSSVHSGVSFFMRHGAYPAQLAALRGPCRRELRRMSTSLFKDLEQARQVMGEDVEGTHGKELYRWALHHSVSTAHMKELFDSKGSMTLLRFMTNYLQDLDRRTPHRIVFAYLGSRGNVGSMAEIAGRFDVTREYVRQVLADERLRSARLFRPITTLPDVRAHYPDLQTSASAFVMDHHVLDRLNARENTHWSPLFALHIMQAISQHDHVLGSWTTLFGKSHWSKGLDLQQPFLITRGMIAPIIPLLTEIERQYELERIAPQEADLRALLEVQDPAMRLSLLEALKVLVSTCFPGIRITDEGFILPANKTQFNEDRLMEVLEKLDVPSHVSVVREVWNSTFPDHPISIGGVRSLASDHKDLFMSIGRASIYGLKRWEVERPGLKAGTIRSIIAEQVGMVDTPLHVEDVVTLVKQFRPDANLKNILQNLKLAREFKIHPGGYVGLSGKVYAKIPDPAVTVPGSLMRDQTLIRFIDQPRSELSAFLASKCQAAPPQIESVIDKAVAKGRLVIDACGVIREVRQNGNASAVLITALPPSA